MNRISGAVSGAVYSNWSWLFIHLGHARSVFVHLPVFAASSSAAVAVSLRWRLTCRVRGEEKNRTEEPRHQCQVPSHQPSLVSAISWVNYTVQKLWSKTEFSVSSQTQVLGPKVYMARFMFGDILSWKLLLSTYTRILAACSLLKICCSLAQNL